MEYTGEEPLKNLRRCPAVQRQIGFRPISVRAYANHDTGLLGIIAVICMIFDHVGSALLPNVMWLRVVGRLAFPLFAWGIAIGAEHTRSLPRYALRLLAAGIVSQPFYMYALNHPLDKLNIFATLLLGLLSIWGLKEKKEWLTVAALLATQFIDMDYGLRGVACILLLWMLHDHPLALSVCFSAYCVMWGASGSVIWETSLFRVRLQTAAILVLPLILWPVAGRTKTPRWLMYAAYPGHLAILWLLRSLLR